MTRIRLVLLIAALALVLVGGLSSAESRVEIRVEEEIETESWRVRYRFAGPVDGMVFPRDLQAGRAGRWTVLDESGRDEDATAAWSRYDGHESIALESPRRQVELRFHSDFSLGSDYLFTLGFSDGSRALYTGHLAARPLFSGTSEPEPSTRIRWRLATRKGRVIRALDRRGVGRLRWDEPAWLVSQNGTYLYFGEIEPVETDRMVAIVDPGLPGWTTEMVDELLPKLFDHYATILKIELPFRPLILMSAMAPDTPNLTPSGSTSKGGTLDGLIQLALGGPGWTERPAKKQRKTLRVFLAHEAFHMWNGQLFTRRLGRSDRWLSEGAATYFAYRALRDMGILGEVAFERALVKQVNRCLDESDGSALANPDLDEDVFYKCGAAVQYLVDRKVGQASGGLRGVPDVFALMFGKAAISDGRYSRFDFLEAVQIAADDPVITAAFERILHRGLGVRAEEFFQSQLASTGLAVELENPASVVPDARGRRLRYHQP